MNRATLVKAMQASPHPAFTVMSLDLLADACLKAMERAGLAVVPKAAAEAMPEHERQALLFVISRGHHCVGTVDSDEKLAAAFTMTGLASRGFLETEPSPKGPIYRATVKAYDALVYGAA
ncbi:hypothetical protein [Tianweitania sediminis]|uniref:Uncharacterized protein n=1 Tax=Tianweitania sediminis TaxID=1502156 RepID=A0A8J7QZX0_9HYPH|nr:hypothetical protein [Tianweitania sediminis]MBP0438452.1 hypothetical protein [Tianweitania sediminis]